MGAVSLFICALALVSLGLSGIALARDTPLDWRFALPQITAPDIAPRFEKVLDYTAETGQAHSPGILMDPHGFSIAWFEGSAEAQADVDIHAVRFTLQDGAWVGGDRAPMITRDALGQAFDPRQLVVTLGNTVQNDAEADALYATVVSVGGWAMASVADVRMDGSKVAHARKLNLSPFLNRSHLVKSPMVAYADGSLALPAYFEMGGAHSTLVRLAPDGRVRDTRRIDARGVKPIQPMIVPLDAHRAVAFLRDFDQSRVLWVSHTKDGGRSWTEVAPTDIPNPSAPVAALPLRDGRMLMAMNDDAMGADRLRLAVSDDGGVSWRALHTLEDEGGDARYPMLRRLPGGDIVLSYSHATKRGIRAVVFNDAWVEAQ
ncbi:exo-alpha-sialidase [Roseovarius sp. 2305UL8-3]|uniref:exo-alpha-sialidase n=1 Tax=Roseovarius conchicola TaxID=3121636 RepID=UPI003529ADDC